MNVDILFEETATVYNQAKYRISTEQEKERESKSEYQIERNTLTYSAML